MGWVTMAMMALARVLKALVRQSQDDVSASFLMLHSGPAELRDVVRSGKQYLTPRVIGN